MHKAMISDPCDVLIVSSVFDRTSPPQGYIDGSGCGRVTLTW